MNAESQDIFDRLMELWQKPWDEVAFGEAQMLIARLRDVLAAPTRVSIIGNSVESLLQRNDAIRVLHLALASNGIVRELHEVNAILRDVEEGGYTLRLTTSEERRWRREVVP